MQQFIWVLQLFVLMFYAFKVGSSWFLSLCEVGKVLRGLLAILAFRVCVVPAHLSVLYYGHVFALTI